jgi:hypothetical protein
MQRLPLEYEPHGKRSAQLLQPVLRTHGAQNVPWDGEHDEPFSGGEDESRLEVPVCRGTRVRAFCVPGLEQFHAAREQVAMRSSRKRKIAGIRMKQLNVKIPESSYEEFLLLNGRASYGETLEKIIRDSSSRYKKWLKSQSITTS